MLNEDNIKKFFGDKFFHDFIQRIEPSSILITDPEIKHFLTVNHTGFQSYKDKSIKTTELFDDNFFHIFLNNKISHINKALDNNLFVLFPLNFDILQSRTIEITEAPKNNMQVVNKENFEQYKQQIEKFIGLTHYLSPIVNYDFSHNPIFRDFFLDDMQDFLDFHEQHKICEKPLFKFDQAKNCTCAPHTSEYFKSLNTENKIKYNNIIFNNQAILLKDKTVLLNDFLRSKKISLTNDFNNIIFKLFNTLAPKFIMNEFLNLNFNSKDKSNDLSRNFDIERIFVELEYAFGTALAEKTCLPFLKFQNHQSLEKLICVQKNNTSFRNICIDTLMNYILDKISILENPLGTSLNTNNLCDEKNLTLPLLNKHLKKNNIELSLDKSINVYSDNKFEYHSFSPVFIDIFYNTSNHYSYSLHFARDNLQFNGKTFSIKLSKIKDNIHIFNSFDIGFNEELNLNNDKKNYILNDLTEYISNIDHSSIFNSSVVFSILEKKDREYDLLMKLGVKNTISRIFNRKKL